MHEPTHQAPGAMLSTLDGYLSGRQQLIACREVLFTAARMYLRPGQRPDARVLGDLLWNSPARDIADEECIVNAARGYLTVLENPGKGRIFRLAVLQQGNELRIGVRLPSVMADPKHVGTARIMATFDKEPVIKRLQRGEVVLDWHFPATELYTHAQALEDAVFHIGALFESAIQATVQR